MKFLLENSEEEKIVKREIAAKTNLKEKEIDFSYGKGKTNGKEFVIIEVKNKMIGMMVIGTTKEDYTGENWKRWRHFNDYKRIQTIAGVAFIDKTKK